MLPGISPVKALMPFMRTPPPDLITKAPPPGTITLGVRFQRGGFGDTLSALLQRRELGDPGPCSWRAAVGPQHS